jgi:NAD(P)-dependent dehydrogenase (short-subunit alcohol dehydrogenase family)
MSNMSMKNLFSVEGKVAVVTGGSRGIGLMIARAYVENGVKVYISSRKAEVCDKVAKELSEHGQCIAIPTDLSNEDGAKHLANEIGECEAALNILVNNAGNNWAAPFDEFDEIAWERVMSLNVKTMFHLTRELAPLLRKGARTGDPARVINIGSIDGLHVPPYETYAYSASKAAVHHMTRVLAKKLGPDGITVNAVAPGYFESKMTEWLLEHERNQLLERCPLGRIGEQEDMAGVAIYLASRAGAYVNGEVIRVDGGTIL